MIPVLEAAPYSFWFWRKIQPWNSMGWADRGEGPSVSPPALLVFVKHLTENFGRIQKKRLFYNDTPSPCTHPQPPSNDLRANLFPSHLYSAPTLLLPFREFFFLFWKPNLVFNLQTFSARIVQRPPPFPSPNHQQITIPRFTQKIHVPKHATASQLELHFNQYSWLELLGFCGFQL